MKILKVFFLVSVLATSAAFAKEALVTVKGMVCAFCAQGITKKFNSEAAVANTVVKLEDGTVRLTFKDGQDLSDEKISAILKDSGYNAAAITRK